MAVVGTPCILQALDCIEKSEEKALRYIADRIKLKVGVFCSGVYTQAALKEISESLKISLSTIESISVSQKDDLLSVGTWGGEKKEMRLSDVTEFVRIGCGRCYDLLSETSDISIGPIGAQEGYSTAIIRTSAGINVMDNAVNMKLLETKEGVDEKALENAKETKKKRKRRAPPPFCYLLPSWEALLRGILQSATKRYSTPATAEQRRGVALRL